MRTCAGIGCTASLDGHHAKRKWCSERCRKRTLYAGTCETCGASTSGDGGKKGAPRHCAECSHAAHTIWTRDTVLAAIRDFAGRYGHAPSARDWNICLPYTTDEQRRRWAEHHWPHVSSVQQLFGTFNEAIRVAGFTPMGAGHYRDPRPGDLLTTDQRANIVARYAAGESSMALARVYGVSQLTVINLAHKAGVAVKGRSLPPLDEVRVAKAKRLYAQGWGSQRIGDALGCSPATVCKHLRRAGVQLRPRGSRPVEKAA